MTILRNSIPAMAFCLILPLLSRTTLAADPTLSPPNGAAAVCPDMAFRITFPTPPTLGTGNIQLRDAANTIIDTIDVAKPTRQQAIGGLANYSYYPVLITGNQAAIYFPNHTLAYGQSYTITIDPTAFKLAGETFPGLSGAAWHFTTKAAPPTLPAKITIAADGTAEFASIQGAIDSIPAGNTAPVTLFIRNGTYNEILCVLNKNHLTFLGEDRKKTIIAYANNDRFNNNSNGNPFAPGSNPSTIDPGVGAVYRRGLFLAHRVTDLTLSNLTLHNTTPHGGSQSETIILNGSPDAHAVLQDLDLYSFQDTLQINGQAYITNCYIEGDVDFMWGTGPCFFENVEAKSVRSNAFYTQIRNPPTNHGFIYKNCTFSGGPDVTGNFLSRIVPARFPASEVVLLDCTLTPAVGPAAWRYDQPATAPDVHFWEYNSHAPDGTPTDMTHRFAGAKQLKLPDDAETIKNYSNATWVLGGKWTPPSPPTRP